MVSVAIRGSGLWVDCDELPARWNKVRTGAKNEVYVDIGAKYWKLCDGNVDEHGCQHSCI